MNEPHPSQPRRLYYVVVDEDGHVVAPVYCDDERYASKLATVLMRSPVNTRGGTFRARKVDDANG